MASEKARDTERRLNNLIAGAAVMLSPGIWALAGQAVQTPPPGAAGWFVVNAFAGSGWGAVSGQAKPAVLLLPGNQVMFVGTMSVGTTTNGTQILNTLPSGYWPPCTIRVPLLATGPSGTPTGGLVISSGGVVECFDIAATMTAAGWCVTYPLDNPVAP